MIAALLLAAATPAAPAAPPRLERRGAATQLIVDGEPFLILGGELGNSTVTDREAMRPHWARLKALGLNTVLAPVSWERVEPEEGRFDWASLDAVVEDARAHDLRLVLLWFGTWKNSMSTYAPPWVKRDWRRFSRARDAGGRALDVLSAFDPDTRAADARAFARMIAHLKAIDGQRRTVLMVQVENEVGMIPDARDHAPAADAAFARGVAPKLGRGGWAGRFGAETAEEAFTAWSLASYVEAVARAGKAAYDLPLYVNAALPRPGKRPGEYPSGGPLPHLAAIWRKQAPSVDLLAPDIYFPNHAEITAAYAAQNPLFVPEANQAGEPTAPARAWTTFGRDRGLGFSPFAIETIEGEPAERLGQTYRLLASVAPRLLKAQADGRIAGFAPPVAFDGTADERDQHAAFGRYRLTVRFVDPWTPADRQRPREHGGIVVQTGPDDFLVMGAGLVVTAECDDGAVGIEQAEEGRFEDGRWRPGRLLNGDETHQGRHIRLAPGAPSLQRVRLYTYR